MNQGMVNNMLELIHIFSLTLTMGLVHSFECKIQLGVLQKIDDNRTQINCQKRNKTRLFAN